MSHAPDLDDPHPERGSSAAYASYYAGMDRTMRQKVALITSYLPSRGAFADMGSGSGSGAYDLARLFPAFSVVGVDIDPHAVAWSQEHYLAPNLSYRVGDIAERLFAPESQDAILDSSVLHHVTSFNGFSRARLDDLIDNQISALTPRGILAIRDFVVPEGPETVALDLPAEGACDGPLTALSTAALFERFALEFRCAAHPSGGIPYVEEPSTRPSWRRFRTSLRAATEFILRKDYRADWDVELKEEYLFYSQPEYEQALRRRGLRILLSRPIWNPWIVRQRFSGQFALCDSDGTALPIPPTNYIIIAEKVARGGVWLGSAAVTPPLRFLTLKHLRDQRSGRVFDLVSRPHPTVNLLPWLEMQGEIAVLCRQAYPRPLLHGRHADPPLDGTVIAGYLNEPIAAVCDTAQDPSVTARQVLAERAGLFADTTAGTEAGLRFYTSPGGVDEIVQTLLVNVRGATELDVDSVYDTGFDARGRIRCQEATQLLRACQAGGMLDARLELGVYDLLLRLGRELGPWIGAELPTGLYHPGTRICVTDLAALLTAPPRQRFSRCTQSAGFLEIYAELFTETDALGKELARHALEYVVPRELSTNTVAALPFTKVNGALVVGIEERNLPAPQTFEGSSRLLCAPAWRLPKAVRSLEQAAAYALFGLEREFGVIATDHVPLGCAYLPTAGLTPEAAVPLAVAVDSLTMAQSPLHWVKLESLVSQRAHLRDGHLLVVALRLQHAARD